MKLSENNRSKNYDHGVMTKQPMEGKESRSRRNILMYELNNPYLSVLKLMLDNINKLQYKMYEMDNKIYVDMYYENARTIKQIQEYLHPNNIIQLRLSKGAKNNGNLAI